jgi:predicted RNase H-like nuclease (RuvC/YqgF family)
LLELIQSKDKIKEMCKANENTVCPRDIYKYENKIVIDYGSYVVTIPIRKRPTYEQWAERRDKKIMKVFRKLKQLKAEYNKQREIVRKLRQQFYRIKREYKELKKQYETLKLPTLEQLLSNKEMELVKMRNKYHTERAKMRVIKSQIRSVKQRFERSRRIAKMQFESYKPMHSLPVSAWKKRIKEILQLMDLYFEKSDINGLIVTKKLNHKDIEIVIDWHQFLNDLLYDLTFDLLVKYFSKDQDEEQSNEQDMKQNKEQKFKKPMLVKTLQNHLYTFDWNSVMQTVSLWLKVKP